ncbi:MAG: hypothetical protein MUF38_20555 [Anaerolineae bacterium]|nr:hypothetical protein [Anaerolineae bacterium]
MRGLAWRAGCIAIWLPLILLPFVLLILAANGEIVISNGGDMPEPEAHPWLRATLIMEIDTRGLNITRSSIASRDEGGLTCVQTDVSFLLWQGEGEPARYCDCYEQVGEAWSLVSTESVTCGG